MPATADTRPGAGTVTGTATGDGDGPTAASRLRRLRRRRRRLTGAAIVVVAAAGYAWFIPVRSADDARLALLAAAHPPQGFKAKPTHHAPVTLSEVDLSRLTAAASATPDQTGAYAVEWDASAKATKGSVADVLVAETPSSSVGARVRAQARSRFLDTKTMKTDGYTLEGRFTVPSATGSRGAVFTSSSASATGTLGEVVMGSGRTVAILFVQGGAAHTRSDVLALGRAEQRALGRAGGAVSLIETSFPLWASVIYGAATVGVLAVGVLGPDAVRRVRERRLAARQRAARRERLARGRKVVRRQAATYAAGRPGGRRR